jgi:2-succinyl-5-enolpyruvyl-6-hydroxy-3-cyclohexene-1-carboxylate synthase
MRYEIENPTYAFVGAFVDELARLGMRHAVICPGSRSTPLAFGFSRDERIKSWVLLDERSAAFFALGLAKSSGVPVALICTSGTAAANFMPAVVEAHESRLPLLVLTADRPPELRDNGAPQAIDQIRLYGTYPKWFSEIAIPEATNEALRYIRTIAGRAFATALAMPGGVVHLNMPFREPLTPAPIADQPLPPEAKREAVAWYGRSDDQPYIRVKSGLRRLEPQIVREVAVELANIERGVIVVGPQDDPHLAPAVIALGHKLGYPILADPLSAVRHSTYHSEIVLDNYDAFLRDAEIIADLEPQVVLRFGAMPVSKPYLLYLKKYPNCRQIVVDGGVSWLEPTALANDMLQTDPRLFCQDVVGYLTGDHSATAWLSRWLFFAGITKEAIDQTLAGYDELFEGKVFTELSRLLPDGSTLFVGNSMPIRDLDTFFVGSKRDLRLMCNRGANGIDGVVSTALATGVNSAGEMVLVIGDLSFYHDLNGLWAAKNYNLNATIIVLNNDGGGIFSFLPQAVYKDEFEKLFGTPHGLDYTHAAALYGAKFSRVSNWAEFEQAMLASFNSRGLKIIEIPTNRDTNVTMHRQIWKALADLRLATFAG